MTSFSKSELDAKAAANYRKLEHSPIRKLYRRLATAMRINQLDAQRLKSLYFMWGYWPIIFVPRLTLTEAVRLIGRFIRIDWHVLHGHRPSEIACVAQLLAERSANNNEIMVEAGCWRGGNTTKFSWLCAKFGYSLRVYDSFEGVEKLSDSDQAKEWNFGGQYSAAETVLNGNLQRFGRVDVCEVHKGWFSETLAKQRIPETVRLAYIDCDLAKGTREALSGVIPRLSKDGYILSQDFHITPVRQMLLDEVTWKELGVSMPNFKQKSVYMVQLQWHKG